MSSSIHPTALVETERIGPECQIGAFAVIHAGVRLGARVVIHPHVVIEPGVSIDEEVEIFPGAYIGKTPKGAGALARSPVYTPEVKIGPRCAIGPHAVIYYDVEIGESTLIGDAASIREQCRIGHRCVIGRHVTLNYNTTIEDRVKIMDHSWMAGNMRVGQGAFISGGVLTANDNSTAIADYDEARVIGPTIEAGAQIGLGAKLMPGITVGAGAVVGAASLVTRDVEPGWLVMGSPARPVRKLERT